VTVQTTDRDSLWARLPSEWPFDLLPEITGAFEPKVRNWSSSTMTPLERRPSTNVPVLTQWPVATLCAELTNDLPALYILTNSGAYRSPSHKRCTARRLGGSWPQRRPAVAILSWSVVATRRSEGTFPAKWMLSPTRWEVASTPGAHPFLPGRRKVHRRRHALRRGGDILVPAAQTPFARDPTFGYRSSNLREWIEEKTAGRVRAADVASISINAIRQGGPARVRQELLRLAPGRMCVVNLVSYRDLEVFVMGFSMRKPRGSVSSTGPRRRS